jgi:VWFA-related protein
MRKNTRIILTISLLFILAVWSVPDAYAQDANGAQIKITQVDNSKFPQVTVYVSVTNAAGEPVGVDPATIQLTENGQVMQPTNLNGGQQGGVGPLATLLVVDISGSMDKAGKMDGAKAAAKAYIDQMRPGDQAGLVAYNTKSNYVQPLTQDHIALLKAIDGLTTGGDTAMFDALVTGEAALKDVSGRKAIIVLTDGLDNRSTHKPDDVIAGISQSGLSISTIGLGDPTTKSQQGLDETGLTSLAQQAGGSYSPASDPKSLTSLFQMYARTLQSEYALTYTSPSALRDGVNRSLTVSLTGAPVSVTGKYNPGGVLPEVPNQSWMLFGGILVGLLVLFFVPMLINLGSRGVGGGGRKKGRVKLTGSQSTGQAASTSRSHVKMK